jgi:hypothetical protein
MIEKGTIITCPTCNNEIAEITKDIFRGDLLSQSLFKGINHPILNGQKMTCEKCSSSWGINGKLHTKSGWMP